MSNATIRNGDIVALWYESNDVACIGFVTNVRVTEFFTGPQTYVNVMMCTPTRLRGVTVEVHPNRLWKP